MKKSEAQGVFYLIVIGAVIYPFILLYQAIGPTGLAVLIILAVAAVIALANRNSKQEQQQFDELALHVLHNRMSPEDSRRINRELSESDFARSSLIRNLQIMRDSIEIALSSKKRDTAESRLKLLKEKHQEVLSEQAHLVSSPVIEEINQVIEQSTKAFHTNLYMNLAEGYMEKARKLKINKSKKKYTDLAMEILQEGIEAGIGDTRKLRDTLDQVDLERQDLISDY